MTAVLGNGLARYADAETATRQASRDMPEIIVSTWALPELVEAAARTGNTRLAASAVGELTETTQPGGTDWALGIEARCRALVSQGRVADGLYREAIDRLGRTRLRPELARAHLLYGEWLRRQNRRTDAGEQLRTAHDLLSAIGMEAFAERARRELLATGETVRKRTAQPAVKASQELTPQESQVALLARNGCPTPRSAPGCSPAPTPSSTTWAKCSPSSASPPAASSTKCFTLNTAAGFDPGAGPVCGPGSARARRRSEALRPEAAGGSPLRPIRHPAGPPPVHGCGNLHTHRSVHVATTIQNGPGRTGSVLLLV
jgi:hypothetical protein